MAIGVKSHARFLAACILTAGVALTTAGTALAQNRLSAFTTNVFSPNGNISEFVNFNGDSQEYFITDSGDPNFGKFKTGTSLAFGVIPGLDVEPGAPNSPGPTGFGDLPARPFAVQVPTGFNIGRMFVSYNPVIQAYFVALDVSAPAALDTQFATQPVAFDVDGNGIATLNPNPPGTGVSEFDPASCPGGFSEIPSKGNDVYRINLDLDQNGSFDVRVEVFETTDFSLPLGAVQLTSSVPGFINRYLQIVPIGVGALDRVAFANLHLDSNGDGVADAGAVGVGADVEFMISNVFIPAGTASIHGVTVPPNDPFLIRNLNPCCTTFSSFVDTDDDECLGGGAEDVVRIIANFACPSVEVNKLVRCVSPTNSPFATSVDAFPGSEVEFQISIQNTGNRPLNADITNDLLSCISPATLVPGTLQAGQPIFQFVQRPAGVVDFGPAFIDALIPGPPGSFPVNVGTLQPVNNCATGPGEQVIFRFRAILGTSTGSQPCNTSVDCSNAVSVTATAPTEDPIPANEEQNGTVTDEYTPVVFDNANQIDTAREQATVPPADDNVASVNSLCRGVTFRKDVSLCTNCTTIPGSCGAFTDQVLVPDVFPACVRFRYTVTNNGEVPELVTISDQNLCDDVNAVNAALPGQIQLVNCEVCPAFTGTVQAGQTIEKFCVLRFNSAAALEAFLARDDGRQPCATTPPPPAGADPRCYRNCARVDATVTNLARSINEPATGGNGTANTTRVGDDVQVVPVNGAVAPGGVIITPGPNGVLDSTPGGDDVVQRICDAPPAITQFAFATVCNRRCQIEVTKQVRCLEGASLPFVDDLQVLPNSRVQYQITVTNVGGTDICRLRLTDLLGNQGTCIAFEDAVSVSILRRNGSTQTCTVPARFNNNATSPFVTGLPFEVLNPLADPTQDIACPGGNLLRRVAEQPDEKLIITFNARVPANAAATCESINQVTVECASEPCASPPVFCCQVTDSARVEVLGMGLTCTKTYTEFSWDSNADCAANDAFQPFVNPLTDLLDKVFPVVVRMQIKATNTGEIPLNVTAGDADLIADVNSTPGVAIVSNETATTPTKLIQPASAAPNNMATWLIAIRFDTAEAARAFSAKENARTACRNTTNYVYRNCASLTGSPATSVCQTTPPPTVTTTCQADLGFPPPCDFTVTKLVKCSTSPDAAYAATVQALPGSTLTYRIQVCNTSSTVKLPRICLTDTLSCGWTVTGAVTATLGAANTNVASNFTTFIPAQSPTRSCHTFTARPAAPWIAPGECLTLTFNVLVPANFSTVGANPDCRNTISVDGYTEVCVPGGQQDTPCANHTAFADVDVRIPRLDCQKEVCLDTNADGNCDASSPFASTLTIPCNTAFPFDIIYRFTLGNTGETDLSNVAIIDPQFVNDVRAAGLTIVSCGLCSGACDGVNDDRAVFANIPQGQFREATCRIRVPSLAAWQLFADTDLDTNPGPGNDANCYVNTASATGTVSGAVCTSGANTTVNSGNCPATVCLRICSIDVTKQVRCLTDCTPLADPEAGWVSSPNVLMVAPGACLQYRIIVQNNSTRGVNVCSLRFTDTMSNAGNFLSGPTDVQWTGAPCVPPPAFNFSSTPFVCNGNFAPGARLVITFNTVVKGPNDATLNPALNMVNSITVQGAADCPTGGNPIYCCQDTDTSTVDVKSASIRCLSKRWSYSSDTDANCVPNAPLSAPAASIDLRDKVFPVLLRLQIDADNPGEVPLTATANDTGLTTCVSSTPGVSFVPVIVNGANGTSQTTASGDDLQVVASGNAAAPGEVLILPGPNGVLNTTPGGDDVIAASNELGTTKTIAPGGTASWFAYVLVETATAARTLARCDGTIDDFYDNSATVSGTLTSGASGICVRNNTTVTGASPCSARIQVPPQCSLTIEKKVVCVDCATGAEVGGEQDTLMTVPGACAKFVIRIRNASTTVKIPRICLTDAMSCNWFDPASPVVATIGAANVSADFAGFTPGPVERCYTFASRPAAPWLAPNETLTISFRVRVPGDLTSNSTCLNTAIARGFTEACAARPGLEVDSCNTPLVDAEINVKTPSFVCTKTVEVLNGDGTVLEGSNVEVSDPEYDPSGIRLTYKFKVRNTGSIPLVNVQICDNNLVSRALAAGLTIGSCGLCTGPCDGVNDQCLTILGPIAPGDETPLATCVLIATSETAWEAFALSDGDNDDQCYANNITTRATPSMSGLCGPELPPLPPQICGALVCIRPAVFDCPPITKAKFDIWNQNETRFSGTERCLFSWDERLLSEYTEPGIPNHFNVSLLQTTKGKARINGVASEDVCGPNSIDSPLLGVAARIIDFGNNKIEIAGSPLVGEGDEAGYVFVKLPKQPGDPLPPPPRGRVIDKTEPTAGVVNRTGVTQQGSFLVFPKVEIKWNAAGQVIQETFIELSNEYPQAVRVQLYFVNGDPSQCNWLDNQVVLTQNEPCYWSARTGDPKGLSPFTALDPDGTRDRDPRNPGGRVLKGYILAWAVEENGFEIRWNYLHGSTLIVNYPEVAAWEYLPWAFRALAGANNGDTLLLPYGQLDLDGVEYDFAPDLLLLDFYASGSHPFLGRGANLTVDTDLTLWSAKKDLSSH